MEMLSHEKLDVYQCSIELFSLLTEIIQHIPRGYSYIADQLHRAALSIPLNVAEAAGRNSPKDKANRYGIARASSLECGAIIDTLRVLKLIDHSLHSRTKTLLVRVASMLSKLAAPQRSYT